jgi:nicotinamide phosphoribosyltransferase
MNTNKENFLMLTDSYKIGHWMMLPEGTENVYSYFESRNGAKYPYTVFFGLQAYLKRYFEGVVVTMADIADAEAKCLAHFGVNMFNKTMWERIVKVHGGKLPLRIKAVAEGTAVPVSNVLFTVEATDDQCAALTNVCETILTHIWASSNVATISRNVKKVMQQAFELSAETNNLLPFMLHDFGFRGVSSVESAGMSGAGHLVNFMGTDTMVALEYADRYYKAGMAGYSVAATEHSVMTSLGKAGEMTMVADIIKKFPKGILSVVSDSYNIVEAIKQYGTTFKEAILSRDGKFVVRPDSPRFVGDKACDQIVWIAKELEKYFGSTLNSKGYKTLHPKIGIIYGDGLSADEIKESVWALVSAGFSAETCVYGMGGGLLQKHNRDTQRSAFKCSAQKRNGEWFDISKTPLDITKASKSGVLMLIKDNNGGLKTVSCNTAGTNLLETVFENGRIVKEITFAEVRKNSEVDYL